VYRTKIIIIIMLNLVRSSLKIYFQFSSTFNSAVLKPMTINNLCNNPGAFKTAKRLGRGPGSGTGKTAGRGQKGHKSRSGGGNLKFI
jgi:hypothetical protein